MAGIIEGDITLTDNASQGLTAAEKACRKLSRQLRETIKDIPRLERKLSNLKAELTKLSNSNGNKDILKAKADVIRTQIRTTEASLKAAIHAEETLTRAREKAANERERITRREIENREKLERKAEKERLARERRESEANKRRVERLMRQMRIDEARRIAQEEREERAARRIADRKIAEEARVEAARQREFDLQMARERKLANAQKRARDLMYEARQSGGTQYMEIPRRALGGLSLGEAFSRAKDYRDYDRISGFIQREQGQKRIIQDSIKNALDDARRRYGADFGTRPLHELGGKNVNDYMSGAGLKELWSLRDVLRNRVGATDWQAKWNKKADKGGRLGRFYSWLASTENPSELLGKGSAFKSGFEALFGNSKIGRGLLGAISGRIAGGMLIGGAGGGAIGGILGGGLAAGPVGMAVGAAMTALISIAKKLSDRIIEYVQHISDIVERTSLDRANESVGLRKKMQMSSDMFNVDPRNVEQIDNKIYSLRRKELEYYRNGASGREIITTGIDWLHLLGTKGSGGRFEDEAQAMRFSEALSNIAKANGLSQQEVETVRYQGMQILSKGYADILDIKPLMNSAPGFVRELLAQTGMSRNELLNSGKTHALTADKFIAALENVREYYSILQERASSRTPEQQKEAAEAIIGASSIWEEKEKKVEAESNKEVANAEAIAGLHQMVAEDWYKMWSDTNEVQDGIEAKVRFEIKAYKALWITISAVYLLFKAIKAIVDEIWNVIMFVVSLVTGLIQTIGYGIYALAFEVADILPDIGPFSGWKESMAKRRESDKRERYIDMYGDQLYNNVKYVVEHYDADSEERQALEKYFGFMNLYTGDKGKEVGRIITQEQFTNALYELNDTGAIDNDWLNLLSSSGAVDMFGSTLIQPEGEVQKVENATMGHKFQNFWTREDPNGILHNYGLSNILPTMGKDATTDIKDSVERVIEAVTNFDKEIQKTQNPHMEKQLNEIKNNTSASAKAGSKIVDVLKEIAGVTVVNKVTRVRPDLVFNFGSYGRSGSRELPNYEGNGQINAGYSVRQQEEIANNITKALDAAFGHGGEFDSVGGIYNGAALS